MPGDRTPVRIGSGLLLLILATLPYLSSLGDPFFADDYPTSNGLGRSNEAVWTLLFCEMLTASLVFGAIGGTAEVYTLTDPTLADVRRNFVSCERCEVIRRGFSAWAAGKVKPGRRRG